MEKRIRELIAANRYLSPAEREDYPNYLQRNAERAERGKLVDEFRSIIYDHNDYWEQIGDKDKCIDLYPVSECWSAFAQGKKTAYVYREKVFILPAMKEVMQKVIDAGVHHADRAREILKKLDSDIARPFVPTYDELNPPPPLPKEYRLSLGDEVHIGGQQFELLSLGDEEVTLFDPSFPLFNKTYPRQEFFNLLKENPLNDKYLQVIVQEEKQEEKVEELGGFLYGNHHFVPAGKFPDDFDATHLMKKGLASDREMGLSTYDWAKTQYSHADFYKASGGSDADMFRCLENGKTYIPGENELFQFIGEFQKIQKPEKAKKEKDAPAPVDQSAPKKAEVAEETPVAEKPVLLVPPKPKPRARTAATVIFPEIPNSERHNFRITDDALGVGTPTQRYGNNIAAIRLLKRLEQESRLATPEEQTVLSQYVGWGGLSHWFDDRHPKYQELKELLTEEEYRAARESSLTAFYTPPVVIRSIYKALEGMNFRRGNILEPSCGVGNFLGMLPDSMAQSQLYGVELDSISGRIAQQLYQKSSIAVQGFEKTELPDSFFDAAVGNVPFGQFKIPDKQYDKHNFLVHDYFFARTLDKVRPGGVVAFITSMGTMDKENPSVRKYIAQRADLLGAIRLPNDTFKSAAGTEVTSDIIFLQKRDRMVDIDPEWVHLNVDTDGHRMNQYFIDHPDMIMGQMQEISGPFGPELSCVPYDGQSLEELLNDAIQNIHAEITEYDMGEELDGEEDKSIPALPDVRNFSYAVVEGNLYYRENSRMNPVEVSATAASRIKGLIAIRECVRQLIEYQTEDYSDSDIAAEQEKLNTLYDGFSKKYGLINSRANTSAFNADSSYCLLASLEILDDEGNFVRKADMFTKRTIRQKVVVSSVDTASEALALSLAEKARIDMPYMMELTGKTEEQIYQDCQRHPRGTNRLYPLCQLRSTEEGIVWQGAVWTGASAAWLYPENGSRNQCTAAAYCPAPSGLPMASF